MASEKNLLTSKRFFGATPVDTFISIGLTGERAFVKPSKTDNVVDLNERFEAERNACLKYCIYGLVQSKWSDCDNIRIEFYIGDSSSNLNPSPVRVPFWVYDRTTNVSATTWSVISRPLDNDSGNLSYNLYRKKKGNYFFPFEIDLEKVPTDTAGLRTNKSIFINVSQPSNNAFFSKEVPFLFFDDEGALLEFGEETAEILDNGEALEINTNFPYLYDRHWMREELNLQGPPYVYFVSDEPLEVQEGGPDDRTSQDKLYPIEISLSEPSKSGLEQVRIEVVYGNDENNKPYTTLIAPSDFILQQNSLKWTYVGENALKYAYVRLVDNFLVEPMERLTLRITPIFGCLADPSRSELLSIYVKDNDIPSFVSFDNQNISLKEARIISSNRVPVKISMSLDKLLLVNNQQATLYIDREQTDTKCKIGFRNGNSYTFRNEKVVSFNKTDLNYNAVLYYEPVPEYDKERKIVVRMSGFTTNVAPGPNNIPDSQGGNVLTIYLQKDLDDNYALINIPYNSTQGTTVIRNVYNVPQSNYVENPSSISQEPYGQSTGSDKITALAYFGKSLNGRLEPNSSINMLSSPGQSLNIIPQTNIKSVVEEQDFSLEITNWGDTPVLLDYNLYEPGRTMVIDVKTFSGISLSTSTNVFTYDGEKFVLRLPANERFFNTPAAALFPYSGNSGQNTSAVAYLEAWASGNITYTATKFGFRRCMYSISIRNNSYNYVGDDPKNFGFTEFENFKKTNILKKTIYLRDNNNSYTSIFKLKSGGDRNIQNYYIGTALSDAKTRAFTDLDSITGTTISKIADTFYYGGIVIIPRGSNSNSNCTKSQIFISESKVVDFEDLTPLSSATEYSAILPTSPIILTSPQSAYTYQLRLNFGPLIVQKGYGVIQNSSYSTTYNQQSSLNDSFVMASSVAGTSRFDNQVLEPWIRANPNLRNQAVIEIVNTGVINSIIEGVDLKPGERLAISELPVVPTNGTTGFHNIVRMMNNISLSVTTNSNFNSSSKKFEGVNFKVSHLNFRLYNSNNQPSNKTFNKTTLLKKVVYRPEIRSTEFPNRVLFPEKVNSQNLVSVYGDKVFVNYPFANGNYAGPLGCENGFYTWTNTKPLFASDYSKILIMGLIVTCSNDSPPNMAFIDSDTDPLKIFGSSASFPTNKLCRLFSGPNLGQPSFGQYTWYAVKI